MPRNKNAKQQEIRNTTEAREPLATLRESRRKAPGTRLGSIDDWREGCNELGRISGRHGHALRDGR